MKLRIIIFLLFVIGMSSSCNSPSSKDQAGLEKEAAADAILRRVASQLKKETDLSPMGTMGQMHYDVEKLGLSFYCYKPVDIVEGRKLLVQSVNAMLNEINQDERIHPFLCRHPFLPRNIQIEIFLRRPDGRSAPQGNLSFMDAKDGFLRYDIHHPTKSGFITVYKETFDEALERIADPSLPLVSFEPNQKISSEELAKFRKKISLVSDDGSIWHLSKNGSWIKD